MNFHIDCGLAVLPMHRPDTCFVIALYNGCFQDVAELRVQTQPVGALILFGAGAGS